MVFVPLSKEKWVFSPSGEKRAYLEEDVLCALQGLKEELQKRSENKMLSQDERLEDLTILNKIDKWFPFAKDTDKSDYT